MKVDKSTPKHKLWLAYAEDDLQDAKAILNSSSTSVVGVLFHSQQCAEKALKAFLVYHNVKFRKIHDLVELVNTCADINHEFMSLKELAHELTPYATKIRYPESYYPDLFEPIGEDAIMCAAKVLIFTKDAIISSAHKKRPLRKEQMLG